MKLKMIKAPHAGQKDMVVNTNHGTYAVDLGETIDVKDEAGNEILGKWGSCFQQVMGGDSKAAVNKTVSVKVTAQVKKEDSEDATEKAAEIEANKMAKSYPNKKV